MLIASHMRRRAELTEVRDNTPARDLTSLRVALALHGRIYDVASVAGVFQKWCFKMPSIAAVETFVVGRWYADEAAFAGLEVTT